MKLTCDWKYSPKTPTAVALGTFDGVHMGHRAVISAAVKLAHAEKLTPAVFTFADLPRNAFLPDDMRIPALCTAAERAELIASLGVELMVCPEFPSLMDMPADAFVKEILLGCLRAKHIVCGYDHRFGSGGKGDAELLIRLCRDAEVGVTIVPPVLYLGERVSSTRIRAALAAGDTEAASAMLGRDCRGGMPCL